MTEEKTIDRPLPPASITFQDGPNVFQNAEIGEYVILLEINGQKSCVMTRVKGPGDTVLRMVVQDLLTYSITLAEHEMDPDEASLAETSGRIIVAQMLNEILAQVLDFNDESLIIRDTDVFHIGKVRP